MNDETLIETTNDLAETIANALAAAREDGDTDADLEILTYEEAGVLTRDAGLVVRIGHSEYQITVVRSR